jgi:hypothetical protein
MSFRGRRLRGSRERGRRQLGRCFSRRSPWCCFGWQGRRTGKRGCRQLAWSGKRGRSMLRCRQCFRGRRIFRGRLFRCRDRVRGAYALRLSFPWCSGEGAYALTFGFCGGIRQGPYGLRFESRINESTRSLGPYRSGWGREGGFIGRAVGTYGIGR